MNREIKFRAWDSVHNRMIYLKDCVSFGHINEFDVYELYFEENVLKCRGYKEYDNDFGGGIADETDLAIMQYTGLKDKNGVEIYEGDIVRYYHKTFFKKKGEEVFDFKNEKCYVVWDIGGACFILNKRKDKATNKAYIDILDMSESDNIEIIGNIYENEVD